MPSRRARHGFTLIELLVVVAIIGLLIGLLFPALRALMRNQRRAATTKLMQEMALAIDQYLAKYPLLGDYQDDNPEDFARKPWLYLSRRPRETGETPYMQLDSKHLAKFASTDTYERAGERDGDVILDAFPSSNLNDQRFRWYMRNLATGGGRPYTEAVAMYSSAGTPSDQTDDLVYRLEIGSGRWTWYRVERDPVNSANVLYIPR